MSTDLASILRAQRSCFEGGQTRAYVFRRNLLRGVRRQLEGRKEAILAALRSDLGLTEREAEELEFAPCMRELDWMLRHLRQLMRRRWPAGLLHFPLMTVSTLREPRGLVLILSPWSQPLRLSLIPVMGALAAGNCVVLKPSEFCPTVNMRLDELFQSVLGPQQLALLEGDAAFGSALVEEPFDFIFYGGSVLGGEAVYRKAAERLTPLSLQLGGKNPCIVSRVGDLEAAASEILLAKMRNMGQSCLAPDYVLVQEPMKERFMDCLASEIRKVYGVDPLHDPDYQPILNRHHFERLRDLMGNARIAWGGRLDETACRIEPTILDHVDWKHPAMRQEIFGPVIPVLSYGQLPALIQRLNRLPHPLAAYFFGGERREQTYVASQMICGSAFINSGEDPGRWAGLPLGGTGSSGFGEYGGEAGFRLFSRKQNCYRRGLARKSYLDAGAYEEEGRAREN